MKKVIFLREKIDFFEKNLKQTGPTADIDCTYSYFPLKAVHNVPSMRFEINQVCLYTK